MHADFLVLAEACEILSIPHVSYGWATAFLRPHTLTVCYGAC